MRRLTAWIGGAVGAITAYRLLRRRSQATAEPSPEAEPDARADELRAKLADSRPAEPAVREPPTPPEPSAEDGPAETESPDERRRHVHEEGRAALDEMKPE
jgi:hypothetical protein